LDDSIRRKVRRKNLGTSMKRPDFHIKKPSRSSGREMLNEDIQIDKTEAMLIGFDVKHTPTHSKNIIALSGRR